MILTKQAQERMIDKYLSTHTVVETKAFIEGMDAMVEFINKRAQDDPYQNFVGC